MSLPITGLYGDPANMELAERVRVHQNFLEYVPLAIILMGILALNDGNATFLHIFGTVLLSAAAVVYSLWIVIKPMLG